MPTMDALVWEGPRTLAVHQVAVPEPGPDEVLLAVEVAGICGSELEGYVGAMANRRPPLVMGHEFTGRVVAGSDALHGKRFAVNPLVTCGQCPACRSGHRNLCADRGVIGIVRPGGFAEFVTVPVDRLLPLEDEVPAEVGALVEPLANVVHAFGLAAARGEPRSVLVLGAGSLGLLAAQVARARGADQVAVVDLNPARLELARAFGATAVRASDADADDQLRAALPDGADVAVDCVGAGATKRSAVRHVRSGGVVVLLGLHEDESVLPTHEIVRRELALTGSYTYTDDDVLAAYRLLAAGAIDSTGWTEVRPLSAGPAAFEELVDRPGASTKILLKPGALA